MTFISTREESSDNSLPAPSSARQMAGGRSATLPLPGPQVVGGWVPGVPLLPPLTCPLRFESPGGSSSALPAAFSPHRPVVGQGQGWVQLHHRPWCSFTKGGPWEVGAGDQTLPVPPAFRMKLRKMKSGRKGLGCGQRGGSRWVGCG